MKFITRVFFIAAGIMLIVAVFVPIWQIALFAPQYPDGVFMYIYSNKIGGATEGTLQNVNILNHYVGMKPIVPDSIPELKLIQPILGAFAIAAFILAYLNKKRGYLIWWIALVIVLLIGFYDFYLWEYNYGHDLDPNAPMIFEGATYQPPLLGRKEILNFEVYSLPQVGGYLLFAAVILTAIGTYLSFKSNKN